MDAETGQVLFDKNIDKIMFPASTTKIMTGLIAAEKCDMNELAEVAKSAIEIDEWNSANIALIPGERLPVDSLMYGLMLPSANDAANVIAEHIAGSQRDFAQMMTERARSLGATSTRFVNAHGLHDPHHYTTAFDMALITREAIKNPVFARYFGAGTHTIPPTNLQPLERPFTNYQYMLVNTTRYYNPDVIGGKVGYTLEARHTMSTAASKDGRTLVCVVMDSPNRGDKFKDTQTLLDFGFHEFTEISVPRRDFPGFSTSIVSGGEEVGEVQFSSGRDFTALLHDSMSLDTLEISYTHQHPFEEGEDVSAYVTFTVTSDDPAIPGLLGSVKLDTAKSMFAQAESASLSFRGGLTSPFYSSPWAMPLTLFGIVLGAFALVFTANRVALYRRRRRRRERLARLQKERETLYSGGKPTVSSKR